MRTEAKRSAWLWVVLVGGCTSGGTPTVPPDVRDSQTPPGEVGLDATEEAAAPDVVDVTAPDVADATAPDQSAVDVPAMETTAADVPGMDTPAADAVDVADVVAEDVARMDAPDGDGASMDARLDVADVVDVVDDVNATVDRPDVTPGECPTTFTTCEACLAVPGCGWCNNGSSNECLLGNERGPTLGTTCQSWLSPREPSRCAAGFPDITTLRRPCASREFGEARECGWTRMLVRDCLPGSRYRVGCVSGRTDAGAGLMCPAGYALFGTCIGNPILRVCPRRDYDCFYPQSMIQLDGSMDDSCDRCPYATIECPGSGTVTILAGSYDSADMTTRCEPALEVVTGVP
ncbi:MAG: hypothetical protein U0324_14225 [Polyangiales bacterium]